MASSSTPPSGNWAELPPELTYSIVIRLSDVEILKNARRVCRSWRRVCKEPSMWRKIDMRNNGTFGYDDDMMCRQAVDLSEGGLVEINMGHFGNDSLFSYIAERSTYLRCLRLAMDYPLTVTGEGFVNAVMKPLTGEGFVSAVMKLPFLEDLEISYGYQELDLKTIGQSCPLLKTLKLNRPCFCPFIEYDDEALAIAETMPKLRNLELFGNRLTNGGLNAILDNCLHLEHLDLRRCLNINLVGDLKKRCSERIRDLKRPEDLFAEPPFDIPPFDIRPGIHLADEEDFFSDDSDDITNYVSG